MGCRETVKSCQTGRRLHNFTSVEREKHVGYQQGKSGSQNTCASDLVRKNCTAGCTPGYSSSQVSNASRVPLVQALNSQCGFGNDGVLLCDPSLQNLFRPVEEMTMYIIFNKSIHIQ